jgi:hypothetical protein
VSAEAERRVAAGKATVSLTVEALSGHEFATTILCKVEGCDGEAEARRGSLAMLCRYHREETLRERRERARANGHDKVAAVERVERSAGTYEARASSLVEVGRKVDEALAVYRPARAGLTAAMQNWARAVEEAGAVVSNGNVEQRVTN